MAEEGAEVEAENDFRAYESTNDNKRRAKSINTTMGCEKKEEKKKKTKTKKRQKRMEGRGDGR